MTKTPKRPRDLNQWAKHMVDIATGAAPDSTKKPPELTAAAELGRLGGLKGGPARAQKLSPKQRKDIAKKAATKRWENKTKEK